MQQSKDALRWARHSSTLALAVAVANVGTAHAQTSPTAQPGSIASEQGKPFDSATSDNQDAGDAQPDIVVTGSFIRGAAQNAALPVSVLNSSDLAKIGSPTINQLAKLLPVSSGTDGETNQFSSPNLEGVSNINLRGLGPARTLVLWNGRRIAQSPIGTFDGQFFVDTNLLPAAAVQRVEILKEGAAALYGSDAVAGVVNFITNRRLKGLALSADYTGFAGTHGDWTGSAAYGVQGSRTSWLTTFGYQHRSEAKARDFPYTIRDPRISVQNGVSSTGNPGVIRQVGGTGLVVDPGCAVVGGTVANGACLFQVIGFENLVERENRYQAYSELTHRFSDALSFHVEGQYSRTDIPSFKTSPSFPPNRPTNFVPASSPGLVALLRDNPGLTAANPFLRPAALATTGGVNVTARPFGNGGFPLNAFGAQEGTRRHDTYRVDAGFEGKVVSNIDWSVYATYQNIRSRITLPDTYSKRFTDALAGLGGPNCRGITPGANGCVYFNPFSNALAFGALNGQANPQFDPSLANSPELIDYITGQWGFIARSQQFVLDAVVSGKTGLELPGGEVGFALGAQYRKDWYDRTPDNADSDFTINPCPTPGDRSCTSRTGVFGFEGPVFPVRANRDVKAVFAELNVPILSTVESQLAIRYEDYGAGVGSTVNPKAALRWEPVRGVVLRGSANTTFRGPQLSQLSGRETVLQLIAPTGAFRAVDFSGNPGLNPEKAFSYSGGLVIDQGGFHASADYYHFRFRSPIIIEPFNFIVANVVAGLASGTPSPLLGRVTFDDANRNGINEATEISRVSVFYTNGPTIRTDGLDVAADYRFSAGPGEVRFGVDGSYLFNYDVAATFVEGLQVSSAFNGVGRYNASTAFVRPLPRWKGNAFLEFGNDDFNLRYTVRHVDDYRDERFDATPTVPGARIKSFTTHDLNALVRTPMGISLTLSVINLTDKDPPYARAGYNYDAYTAYPFGRTFKVGTAVKF